MKNDSGFRSCFLVILGVLMILKIRKKINSHA